MEKLYVSPKTPFYDIAVKIIKMSERDQKAISNEDQGQVSEVLKQHTKIMKQIVAKIGWPTKSKVGENASNMAWLLVQHSDDDVEFQKQCLKLMKKAPDNEVNRGNIAYLEDRVRVNCSKPQLYGTQFVTDGHRATYPHPIHDKIHLEARRKTAGLEPFEEYERQMLQIEN